MPVATSYDSSTSYKSQIMKPRSKLRLESDNTRSIQHQELLASVNIHHDPRIARGSAFAGDRGDASKDIHSVPEQTRFLFPTEPTPKAKGKPRSHLRRGRLRSSSSLFETAPSQRFTNFARTQSRYLIDPRGAVARLQLEAGTHTDDFEERPQTPDFVPKKTGVDTSTQIEAWEKLFDWNKEIEPLLAVLVGKTLDQASIEVEREHELEQIRLAAATLKSHRTEEALRVSKLKEVAVLAERGKEGLRRRQREAAAQRRSAKEKVASLQFVRQVLPLSLGRAFTELEGRSWTTPTTHQIKTQFLPWLFERVATRVDKSSSASEAVESLLDAAKESAAEAVVVVRDRVINLFVPAELVGGEVGQRLGPISVRARDMIMDAEQRVIGWLEADGRVEEVTSPEGGFLAGYVREARKRRRGIRLVKTSLLMELQEVMGVSNDVLLQAAFDD